jgi:hypothetical protein
VAPPVSELRFADAEALADLGTFVARARALDADGAIRLQAHGMALAAYVGVLPGRGLMADGAVIGLRVMPLAEAGDLDVTVPLAGISDRLARTAATGTAGDATLPVPPGTVSAGWAAVAPPRSGWERVGELPTATLTTVATQGIAEIAQGAPAEAGGHAVTALRQRVWARQTETMPPVAAGGAFAAYALGFVGSGGTATVFAHGRWTRISTDGGHVLLR